MDGDVLFGMQSQPRSLVFKKAPAVEVSPGIMLDRIQPGGRDGPNCEVRSAFPGGRVWTDSWILGTADDDFQLMVPDIRLPPNQHWPLHWHDCWIAVVVLDGTCLVGDWWMSEGDVLISAAGLEYGPLVIGPDGCQMFEVFARLADHAGGYSPEYRDHPTLIGGTHVFKNRSELNRRNDGRTSLPVDGVDGLIKTRLGSGMRWHLGEAEDPNRGMMGCTALRVGETVEEHSYGDWHAMFVLSGSGRVGATELATRDVLLIAPEVRVPRITAAEDGLEIFSVARTTKGMERRPIASSDERQSFA